MPTLTINNTQIEVEEGTTLLHAMEKAGVKLPTLCHHKALTPYGACRLCIVEVHVPDRPAAVQAACSLPRPGRDQCFRPTARGSYGHGAL